MKRHCLTLRSAVSVAIVLLNLCFPPASPGAGAETQPELFFAMDTALNDGQKRSPEQQADLLRQLGYAGIGASGYPTPEFFVAFEARGLRVLNTYITVELDSAKPGVDPKLAQFVPTLKGRNTALWIAIPAVTRDGKKLKPSSAEGDAIAAAYLQELGALAAQNGVRIALYPHTWFWLERVEDAVRVALSAGCDNVGVTFNLCHWLKVEGDRDPTPVLTAALPKLMFVTINGAQSGDTKAMAWDQLIQPLGQGSYDVAKLMRMLRDLGYHGAVGFQGYGIKGDSALILEKTMHAWRRCPR